MPHPLFKTIGESIDKPPVPPPRYKRKTASVKSGSTPVQIASPKAQSPVGLPPDMASKSAEVLEEVASDLIRLGNEIDPQPQKEDSNEAVTSRPKSTPNASDEVLKGKFDEVLECLIPKIAKLCKRKSGKNSQNP